MTPLPSHHFPAGPILLVIIACIFLAGMDTMAKFTVLSLPVMIVIWGRYFFHTVITFVYYLYQNRSLGFLRAQRPDLQFYRAACLFGITFTFYTSLQYMPLGDAAAIQFLAPVLVTAFSGILLGEQVGPRRWVAVACGFIGVLLVSRPGSGVFGWIALLPLCSAVFMASYFLLTRIIRDKDNPDATTFYSTALGAIILSILSALNWEMPTEQHWALLIAMGSCGAIAHFLLVKAFHSAEASALSPFTYSHVVFAIILGYLVFGDTPSPWTIAGASLVVGSGLYIWYRESALSLKAQ